MITVFPQTAVTNTYTMRSDVEYEVAVHRLALVEENRTCTAQKTLPDSEHFGDVTL